jgi:hypothetical protein
MFCSPEILSSPVISVFFPLLLQELSLFRQQKWRGLNSFIPSLSSGELPSSYIKKACFSCSLVWEVQWRHYVAKHLGHIDMKC